MASTRTARRLAARSSGLPFTRDPGSNKPFKAEAKRMNEMQEIIERGKLPFDRQLELSALPPLVSRGHGGRYRTKQRIVGSRQFQDRSKYDPRAEEMKRHRGLMKLRPKARGYDLGALVGYADALVARVKPAAQAVA